MQRNTIQRESILRVLLNTKSHPKADYIYDEVRKEIPSISKGTVYRNLGVLRHIGIIDELNLDGTITRFEAAHKEHYHLRCESCGIIIDLDMPLYKKLDREVAERTGLKILYHQLEFRGLCRDCQSKIPTKRKTKNK